VLSLAVASRQQLPFLACRARCYCRATHPHQTDWPTSGCVRRIGILRDCPHRPARPPPAILLLLDGIPPLRPPFLFPSIAHLVLFSLYWFLPVGPSVGNLLTPILLRLSLRFFVSSSGPVSSMSPRRLSPRFLRDSQLSLWRRLFQIRSTHHRQEISAEAAIIQQWQGLRFPTGKSAPKASERARGTRARGGLTRAPGR